MPVVQNLANKTNSAIPRSNATVAVTVGSGTNDFREEKDVLASENDVPIVFYGRLEDQHGNPVVGAQITGSTIVYNGVHSGANRYITTSDVNGSFTLEAGKGESLGIMPKKEGYVLATSATEFRYSRLDPHPFKPDAGNPTVIKMWKLEGSEALVPIDQHYKLKFSEKPISFDLITGKIVDDGGDIRLTVKRTPGVMSGRNRLEWGVQVEAVNGGVIESGGQDAITYSAPETGYLPSDTLTFSTNAPYKWFEFFNQGYFVMSRGGQVYSRVGISFRINANPDDFMSINFNGVANANGSRNWEASAPK